MSTDNDLTQRAAEFARDGREQMAGKPQAEPLLISVCEAARRIGLSKSTVYELIDAGEFPHKRVGRRLLVPVRMLEQWAHRDVLDSAR